MQEHPRYGAEICASLKSVQDALPIIRWHHEKLDGSGYPDGLKNGQIPVTAQVMAIADVYDALATDRPYRGALPPEECFEILRDEVHRGWRKAEYVELFIQLIKEKAYELEELLSEDEDAS